MFLPKSAGPILLCLLLAISAHSQSGNTDSTVSFRVDGTCSQCKQRIEKSLNIKGVESASWNVKSHLLTATFNPGVVSVEELEAIIAATGHDTEHKKAKDKVYKTLPECCLYREVKENSYLENIDPDADDLILGLVVESVDEVDHPLAGASISLPGNDRMTVSNSHGEFILHGVTGTEQLIISYAGYRNDTVSLNGMHDIQITLSRKDNLQGIVITARQRPYYTESLSAIRTAIMTKKELLKAACCNLSESFETNPAVDVAVNDAATGSKQIQLLGLAGNYTQLTVENMPGPRGLATHLGLNSIAGPWIEAIQIIKGSGSVVNGFESMVGQINVELRKPRNAEKLYLNGYTNSIGKTDINVNLSHKINSKWSTSLLLHDDFLYKKDDANEDGFRDLPTGNLFSGISRWQYVGEKGLISHFGIKVLFDDRTGGQIDFTPSTDKFTTHHYGVGIQTNRYEAFGKIGYVFPHKTSQSIGLQLSAFSHEQDSYFGMTRYDGTQKNVYANLVFQSTIGTSEHVIKGGLSLSYDRYDEKLNDKIYERTEAVPGAFTEIAFKPFDKVDIVAGIRGDHNNLFGWFATPRINIRYSPFTKTTIRLSAGRGQRTANIFAENMGMFVSSRQIRILNVKHGKGYGLDPEISWIKGISIDQKFNLFDREAGFAVDYYRNDFVNQVVADLENTREVKFYNLEGRSFSNSFQAELNFVPVKKLEARIAYRFFDVKTTYHDELLEKPFTAKHRAFANLAYEWKGWSFDYTMNITGRKRIPSTIQNPLPYQMEEYSPSYITINGQISKVLGRKKQLELYLGAENLTNYFQEKAIISPDDPFGYYFDGSMIWGPLGERLWYGGFRFTLK